MRIVVAVAPGGGLDATARLLQEPLAELLGQQVIVENRAGGDGTIASRFVAAVAPDGYTLAVIYTSHAVNPHLMSSLPYDSFKSFTPIAFVWRAALAFSVPQASPIKSLADVIQKSKQDPGSIGVGTTGSSSANYLSATQLQLAADVKLTDVLGGHIALLSSNVAVVTPQLRALAVTSPQRSPAQPNVPTVAELGYPGFQVTEWFGLVGPANLPPDIVMKLNEAIKKAAARPDIAPKLEAIGHVSVSTPGEFSTLLIQETERMGEIIRKSGIPKN